jgi:hypothetical protein
VDSARAEEFYREAAAGEDLALLDMIDPPVRGGSI